MTDSTPTDPTSLAHLLRHAVEGEETAFELAEQLEGSDERRLVIERRKVGTAAYAEWAYLR